MTWLSFRLLCHIVEVLEGDKGSPLILVAVTFANSRTLTFSFGPCLALIQHLYFFGLLAVNQVTDKGRTHSFS